jgi:hypothetical protein
MSRSMDYRDRCDYIKRRGYEICSAWVVCLYNRGMYSSMRLCDDDIGTFAGHKGTAESSGQGEDCPTES